MKKTINLDIPATAEEREEARLAAWGNVAYHQRFVPTERQLNVTNIVRRISRRLTESSRRLRDVQDTSNAIFALLQTERKITVDALGNLTLSINGAINEMQAAIEEMRDHPAVAAPKTSEDNALNQLAARLQGAVNNLSNAVTAHGAPSDQLVAGPDTVTGGFSERNAAASGSTTVSGPSGAVTGNDTISGSGARVSPNDTISGGAGTTGNASVTGAGSNSTPTG